MTTIAKPIPFSSRRSPAPLIAANRSGKMAAVRLVAATGATRAVAPMTSPAPEQVGGRNFAKARIGYALEQVGAGMLLAVLLFVALFG